jgi:hypothetical protein
LDQPHRAEQTFLLALDFPEDRRSPAVLLGQCRLPDPLAPESRLDLHLPAGLLDLLGRCFRLDLRGLHFLLVPLNPEDRLDPEARLVLLGQHFQYPP